MRHPTSPGTLLLLSQDDAWLRERRRAVGMFGQSRTESRGETRTMAGAGLPIRYGHKWIEYVDAESGWNNPHKTKQLSKNRAELIRTQFLLPISRQLALENG